jgi:hypothetical protein
MTGSTPVAGRPGFRLGAPLAFGDFAMLGIYFRITVSIDDLVIR